jgi:DNA-binding response OmpR family regulator
MMPEISGYDVCSAIRARDKNTPIIMLTAKGEEIDKVVGLRMGADDYITKPFGIHELIARIEAALRRSRLGPKGDDNTGKAPGVFQFALAEVNELEYTVRLGDRVENLSHKELELLRVFHSHPNEALSRERLLDEVWGIKYFGTTRTLDQHIARLRKKIEPDPSNPESLKTVHGVGYKYLR